MKNALKKSTVASNQYEKNDITPGSSCTLNHNELDLLIEGNIYKVYGSSCIIPVIHDADVYISLDCQAPSYQFEQDVMSPRKHIRCFIKDGTTPKNECEFDACVEQAIQFIKENKKVHVGCIAGHGRTGLFLSAIVQKCMKSYLDEKSLSAIDYVRDKYCYKAVETLPQILYLNHYYGVTYPKNECKKIKEMEIKFKSHTGFYLQNKIRDSDFNSCMEVIQMLDMKDFPYKGLITRSIRF